MRSVSIRLEDLCKITIPIGFAGENLRTTVRIDCMKMFHDYPDAIATLSVKPPEGKPYPTVVTRDGDIVVWEVTSSDLASQGYGEIQLSFLVDDVVAKSFVGKTRVDKSILPTGQAPDPIKDWIVRAEAALEGIPATIQAALEEAKESGEFDGFSPIANVTKEGNIATITITDKEGTTTATVSDGDYTNLIDDTTGAGITTLTWSADKLTSELDLKAPKASPVFTGSVSMGRLESYTTGDKSVAVGDSVEASAYAAFAEGGGTRARGRFSHSEGEATTASGQGSHAEGTGTQATASQAHAEGLTTTASASYTHAEGSNTTASSVGAHAEGMFSTASGMASHSQGFRTIANANFMSASGIYNKQADIYPAWVAGTSYEVGDRVSMFGFQFLECKTANSDETFDWTKWEEIDFSSDTLFVIGNGVDESHRSNAMEIDLHGNENLTGDLTVNKGSANEISVGTIKTDLDSKAPIANPEFTGSISMGRAKNTTIGAKSVAIGASAEATAPHSVSLGIANRANMAAFAQGDSNNASAYCSFARGFGNVAKGNYSSATGFNSVISGNASHAFGRYNVDLNDGTEPDSLGTYIEIVGNGTGDNDRSNARTLDQSGNEALAGDLTINKGSADEVSVSELADDVGDLKNQITSLDNSKAPIIIDSASGEIATFPDGADGLPLVDLTVDSQATKLTVCGKNFFDKEHRDATAEISPVYNSSGGLIDGTKSGFRYKLPPGTYTIHIEYLESTYIYANVQDSQYNFVSYASLSTTSIQQPKQITIREGDILVIFRGTSTDLSIDSSKLQIELGTTATESEAYIGKTYTLVEGEPTEPVLTLYGTNNIFSDTGDVAVDYRADTKLWINGHSGSSITVDSALSSTSENPVQNKVINTALAAKEPKHNTTTVSGTTPSITGVADTRYICGEVSTLTIVAPASGCIDVTFTSGSTATVLTVTPPTGMTMKWANGFDPTSLEANTTYEINIMDGCLGVAGSWT